MGVYAFSFHVEENRMPALQVDVYSHNFHLSHYDQELGYILANYSRRNLAQWGPVRAPGGRVSSEIKCEFIAATSNHMDYGFLTSQYDEIMAYVTAYGYSTDSSRIIKHPAPEGVAVTFELREAFMPRSYQPPIITYLVAPGCNKVVELQTGKGKTALALKATQEIGTRTFLIIRPMYIDKWIGDVEGFFITKPGDVMVIKGGASLKRLIELGQGDELNAKFIICSNATLRMYLDEHEQFNGEVSSYGVVPSELFAVLKVGLVIFDEVHQDFHFNYRMFSYINVKKTIALSATLDPDDRTLKRRYMTAFPMELRSPPVEYDKYIEVQALYYSMESMNKVRYKNFFGQYQHTLYEQSIMKDSKRIENYRRMMARVLKFDYIRVAQPGMRCVMYFATVEMCTLMQEYLSKVFPDRVIRRYVSEDDYHTNLMGAEIIITTLQSAGTAVDIPNLAVNIMTVALNSKQSNIQGLGRLRRLKDFPDFTPKFVYLVCTSLDKHVKYHQEKLTKFEGKVLSHKELQTDFRI